MNTVHSYTNDQVLTDVYHSDLRRARSAVRIPAPAPRRRAAVGRSSNWWQTAPASSRSDTRREHLIVGVRVHRVHDAGQYADLLVQDFGERRPGNFVVQDHVEMTVWLAVRILWLTP